MRAMENRDRFGTRCTLDVWIGAREMTEQGPIRLAVPDPDERNVRHMRFGGAGRNERRERVIVHEARYRDTISGADMAWNVKTHGALAALNAGSAPAVLSADPMRHRAAREREHARLPRRTCSGDCRIRR